MNTRAGDDGARGKLSPPDTPPGLNYGSKQSPFGGRLACHGKPGETPTPWGRRPRNGFRGTGVEAAAPGPRRPGVRREPPGRVRSSDGKKKKPFRVAHHTKGL